MIQLKKEEEERKNDDLMRGSTYTYAETVTYSVYYEGMKGPRH